MATGLNLERKKPTSAVRSNADRALYLYGISQKPKGPPPAIVTEGIDGVAPVESVACENYLCWMSRVSRREFAEDLVAHMEDLEWLATAGLRHQRVVSAIVEKLTVLPARFGTVFLSDKSLAQHVRKRRRVLPAAFKRVADADEWGVKIFELRNQPSIAASDNLPASGAEYLKSKAKSLRPRREVARDEQLRDFIRQLDNVAVDSSAGGKASAGQPGLLWHGSFLVKRKDRRKLEDVLKKYAGKWHERRRVDCSGPWPPYSFVEAASQRGRPNHGQ